MDCSLLNLPECIFEASSSLLLEIVNAPVLPLLDVVKRFLTLSPNIEVFAPLWAVIVYIISAFYGLFIIAAGFNFIISGHNAEKRAQTKMWLSHIVLMMFFVQASFLLYSLITQIASSLTAGIVDIIDTQFFLFTIDNRVNVHLELFFGPVYVLILILTAIALSVNYLFTSVGVLFFPFGLFFYFIPPLRDIGKLIMSVILFMLFTPFIASLILLGGAELVKVNGYEVMKILIVTGSFALIDITLVLLAIVAVFRSIVGVMRTDVARGILFFKGAFLTSAMQKPETSHQSREEEWSRMRNFPRQYRR